MSDTCCCHCLLLPLLPPLLPLLPLQLLAFNWLLFFYCHCCYHCHHSHHHFCCHCCCCCHHWLLSLLPLLLPSSLLLLLPQLTSTSSPPPQVTQPLSPLPLLLPLLPLQLLAFSWLLLFLPPLLLRAHPVIPVCIWINFHGSVCAQQCHRQSNELLRLPPLISMYQNFALLFSQKELCKQHSLSVLAERSCQNANCWYLSVGESHRLNSVKPTDFRWVLWLILRNDPLGLLWDPGKLLVAHDF